MATRIRLDYETASECDLKKEGLHRYAIHPSTRVLMIAWAWNDEEEVHHADLTRGDRIPQEVIDALEDPEVEKWAFNAAFERMISKHVLGLKITVRGWRCTMVLGFMRSFTGGLEDMGTQLGLPSAVIKNPDGKKLIRMFCMPQKVTKTQPHVWRSFETDPDEWVQFCAYCMQDVRAEHAIMAKIINFPTLASEWRLYEIDQIINDRGLPVDRQFVEQASIMSFRRKVELIDMMNEITGLRNSNSTAQLIPWLQARGYPFSDMKKLTVKKVLTENEELPADAFERLAPEAVAVLKLRQQSARTSVRKYAAIINRLPEDDRLRHCFQFGGAARTNRWSGRGPQPQNLVRTPKEFSELTKLVAMLEAIRQGDYEGVGLLTKEPMDAFAGVVRSSFKAPEGHEFVVCDLSAIESAVIAWLSNCTRLLTLFSKTGKAGDPYLDFGSYFRGIKIEDITPLQRQEDKPAVLGCGFGLGGGKLVDGKKTGLWGYAEGMGVNITQETAIGQVDTFRKLYSEIPEFWKSMDSAMRDAMTGKTVDFQGKLLFKKMKDFMTMQLPSGRVMYYYKPKMLNVDFKSADGRPYTVKKFTCMGVSQITKRWGRITSGGPKVCENAVQATAREILAAGMHRAHKEGFKIVGSVHDELIALRRKGDNYFSLDLLRDCMIEKSFWMEGLPLKAAGYVSEIYRKD